MRIFPTLLPEETFAVLEGESGISKSEVTISDAACLVQYMSRKSTACDSRQFTCAKINLYQVIAFLGAKLE